MSDSIRWEFLIKYTLMRQHLRLIPPGRRAERNLAPNSI